MHATNRSLSLSRRSFVWGGGLAGLGMGLAACSTSQEMGSMQTHSTDPMGSNPSDMSALTIDSGAWSHDADNDVYYQIGVRYCASPEAEAYESMGIYVPGAYFDATDNGDGTFSCKPSTSGTCGKYSTTTAPIVIPVNTAGYSAQAAPTSYSYQGLSEYLEAGLIYVYAGCRGRGNGENDDGTSYAGGAPWGVTDLKAAIRCLRYNAGTLPGDMERVFSFGMSGGGAQSALLGATGDSALYVPYLEHIGAVMADDEGSAVSDAVLGSMCWCPITELDVADEAYEWMMGQFSSEGTRAEGSFTKQLSDDLSQEFARFVNNAGLADDEGNALTLSEGGEGIYASGSYYDYVLATIEGSLNNFLEDTTFPYTPSNSFNADGGFGGGTPSGTAPSSGATPSGSSSSGVPMDGSLPGGEAPAGSASSNGSSTTTYSTVDEYISSLNSSETWVSYDSLSNTASISSVGAFVRACKSASKNVGAFDGLDRGEAENQLFGVGSQDYAHFDKTMGALLSEHASEYSSLTGWDGSYPTEYATDLGLTDDLGVDSSTRQNMYNPLYFLLDSYEGSSSSTPATHWRIRTGVEQGDTSLTTEMNLALALRARADVRDVDFETVWGMGHTMAERTGNSTTNFISWIASCCS